VTDRRALKICSIRTGARRAGSLPVCLPGWRPQPPAADCEFAVQAGVMFPPRDLTHEWALQRIGELRSRLSPPRAWAQRSSAVSCPAKSCAFPRSLRRRWEDAADVSGERAGQRARRRG
jgi:hypothetical protein